MSGESKPKRTVRKNINRGLAFVGMFGALAGGSAEAASAHSGRVTTDSAAADVLGHDAAKRLLASAEFSEAKGVDPHTFIKTFNVKLARLTQEMHTSPHFSKVGDQGMESLSISLPSKEYPGRYDSLDVLLVDGSPIPDSAQIFLGADTKSPGDTKDWKEGYLASTTAGPGLGRWLALDEDHGPTTADQAKNYYVSTGGYSGMDPGADITYDKSSRPVATAYDNFLKKMKAFITAK